MKGNLADQDFEGLSGLIREEEENALAYFRARNFMSRLESLLRETAEDKEPTVLGRRMAVPAIVAVLVFVAAGVLILVLRHPRAGPSSESETLASALGRLPGLSHPLEPEWARSNGQGRTSLLADSIRQALITAEEIKKEEEKRLSIPAGTGKVPRLSPEQRMEILFQEKAIERALLLIKEDSREV